MNIVFFILGLLIGIPASVAWFKKCKSDNFDLFDHSVSLKDNLTSCIPLSVCGCAAVLFAGAVTTGWSNLQTILYSLLFLVFPFTVYLLNCAFLFFGRKFGGWAYWVAVGCFVIVLSMAFNGLGEFIPTLKYVLSIYALILAFTLANYFRSIFVDTNFARLKILSCYVLAVSPIMFMASALVNFILGLPEGASSFWGESYSFAITITVIIMVFLLFNLFKRTRTS